MSDGSLQGQTRRGRPVVVGKFIALDVPGSFSDSTTNAPKDAAEVVVALIGHPAVKRINFTGSTTVGRIIAKRAAEHLKPCPLELGGKAPLIVLDDADLDEAVEAAAFGAFMNQGHRTTSHIRATRVVLFWV